MNQQIEGPVGSSKTFFLAVLLNAVFIVVEVVWGILSGSLSLLADAGHNLSDVMGLILAWGAFLLVRRPPTLRRTYGWRSSTIMAALLNGVILLIAIGGIAMEAVRRFGHPSNVSAKTVIIVAAVGVVINTVTAFLFFSDRKKDLNIRGAFLHMAADAGVSAGVALSGVGIMATGRLWIDPVVSLIVVVVILIGTWGLLKESLNLAMHAVPAEIDLVEVNAFLVKLPGIVAVHDLHVWAMSTTETALTAHLVKPDPSRDDEVLAHAVAGLKQHFNIQHVTIQWEREPANTVCDPVCRVGPVS